MAGAIVGARIERSACAALIAAGHPDTVVQFPAGPRTAADAAAAIINFRSEGRHFPVGRCLIAASVPAVRPAIERAVVDLWRSRPAAPTASM